MGAGQNGVGGFSRGFGRKLTDVYWEKWWLKKKKTTRRDSRRQEGRMRRIVVRRVGGMTVFSGSVKRIRKSDFGKEHDFLST